MKQNFKVYTDGACSGNGKDNNKGGIGVLIKENDDLNLQYISTELNQGFSNTTNNRMELQAAITALQYLEEKTKSTTNKEDVNISMFVDSEYVQKGITNWIENWKKKNWKTAKNQPVLNQELWQQLDELSHKFPSLSWQWVKGHSNDVDNEIVDKLAVTASKNLEKYSELTVKQTKTPYSNEDIKTVKQTALEEVEIQNTQGKEMKKFEIHFHNQSLSQSIENFIEKNISTLESSETNKRLFRFDFSKADFEVNQYLLSLEKTNNLIHFTLFYEQGFEDVEFGTVVASGVFNPNSED